jgi:hypothetical protein
MQRNDETADEPRFQLESTRKAMIVMSVVLTLMGLGGVLLRSIETAVAFAAIDDGLYYPIIARNLLERGKMTFDGVTSTNGFHPLWMLLMIPLCAITSDPEVTLRMVFALAFMVMLAALYLFTKVVVRLRFSLGGVTIAFVIVFANIRSFTMLLSTIEAPIVLLMYLAYIHFSLRTGDRRFTKTTTALLGGILMGLAFLARTDSVFLCASYGLLLLYHLITKKITLAAGARAGLAAAGGVLAIAIPYCAVNYANFGHVLSVSGHRKIASFSLDRTLTLPVHLLRDTLVPRLTWAFGLPGWLEPVLIWATLLSGLVLTLGAALRLRRQLLSSLAPLAEFVVFAAVHFCWVWFFMPGEALISSWYYVSELLVVGIGAGTVMPPTRRANVLCHALAGALLLLQVLAYPRFVRNKTMTWAKFEIAHYVRDHLPPNARLGMFDAGITSYFSHRDFVVLGGLAGDFEQSELTAKNDIGEIARRYGVTHIVLDLPLRTEARPPARIVFQGSIQTKFSNFLEGMKRFVVFEGTPSELDAVWRWRWHLPPR